MSRLLIDFISPTPNRLTGISVYSFQIAAALIAHGVHDYVFSTNWDLDRLPRSLHDGAAKLVHRAVPANETRALIRSTIDLPAIARAEACEAILHTQPTAMLGRLQRSAIVVHDLYRVTNPELYDWKQRTQWNLLIAHGLRRAAAIIAVSGATRDALVAAYPEIVDRVRVVHEAAAIALPDAGPIAPASHPAAAGHYGLVVANVTANKNVPALIAALGLLAQRGIRPTVLLAGRDEIGALSPALAAYPDVNLVHLGPVSDEELRRLYAGARVYVNTSLVEGFCLPILEAQSFGVPVICSDLPVLREVAGIGALFVDPLRPDELARAIGTLFGGDEAHVALARASRANAARFSWRKAALETEAVLETVIEDSG